MHSLTNAAWALKASGIPPVKVHERKYHWALYPFAMTYARWLLPKAAATEHCARSSSPILPNKKELLRHDSLPPPSYRLFNSRHQHNISSYQQWPLVREQRSPRPRKSTRNRLPDTGHFHPCHHRSSFAICSIQSVSIPRPSKASIRSEQRHLRTVCYHRHDRPNASNSCNLVLR